jgi:diacylglycerol kinase
MKFRPSPSLVSSLRHALRGLGLAFRTERNFRLQILLGCLAAILGLVLGLSALEWLCLAFVVGLVLVLELLNSSFERMVDLAKPRLDDAVRDLKDILAGAVLVAALTAVLVGVVIFLPKLVVVFA